MKIRLFVILVFGSLFLSGCAGTPKVSVWNSPPERRLSVANVFDAAMIAGTENKFSVLNSDRQSGVISMKQEVYGGDHKNNERRMSIRIKQASKSSVEIKTKVSGSDFGIIEGLLGGLVHQEITNNFYVYLFRELNITDPSQKQIQAADENKTNIDTTPTPAYLKKDASTKNDIRKNVVTNESEPSDVNKSNLNANIATNASNQSEGNKSNLKITEQNIKNSSDSMVVNKNKAQLRKKPNSKAGILMSLKKGAVVKVIEQRDDWFMIELTGGDVGWCHKTFLAQKN